ncbi:hypothetical protein [Ferroacidibacillus organovorans]|uniref:Uncharacterized protein n=1 Tax=Ferroacidibacillus organovorans TaxID=1765683 RepID=A0A853KBY7_9BACL|nr:hypothetical protein [Ferroacidibacillus organovorans]KYP79917.1 hypothetical protein AYJ22_03195 [Ferroacidibacillus organovorans]OAG94605.1 hypothetical protein AYW79_04420 [Ferroacidibacillus organovorans]
MNGKKRVAIAGTLIVFALAGCGSGGGDTGNSGGGMGNMDMSNGTMNMTNGTMDMGNQTNSTK